MTRPKGERTVRWSAKRVVLAKTLIEQPDLLLLDEPTNHLDFESITWLINYVKQYPHTVLFVTHDRYFLNEIASRIIELDRGKLKSYPGNYEDYIAMRAENEIIEQKQQEKQKALYKQELAWMRAALRQERQSNKHVSTVLMI